MSTKRNNPETIAIHGGDYRSDPSTNAVAVPIYRTTSYQFDSTEHAANLFALKEFGNIYTRIMNPTNDVLEKRVAALDGGLACLTVSSGQTASTFAVLNVAQAGDNIVSSTDLYGGTVSLFTHTLSKLGIEIRYADPSDPKNFEKVIDDKTRAFYGETLPNPYLRVFPIKEVSDIGRKYNIPLIHLQSSVFKEKINTMDKGNAMYTFRDVFQAERCYTSDTSKMICTDKVVKFSRACPNVDDTVILNMLKYMYGQNSYIAGDKLES